MNDPTLDALHAARSSGLFAFMRRQWWFRRVAIIVASLNTLAMVGLAWSTPTMPMHMDGGHPAAQHCAPTSTHDTPAPHHGGHTHAPDGCAGLCCLCALFVFPSPTLHGAARAALPMRAAIRLADTPRPRRLPHVLHFANGPPPAA
jgi:hypothetical protein